MPTSDEIPTLPLKTAKWSLEQLGRSVPFDSYIIISLTVRFSFQQPFQGRRDPTMASVPNETYFDNQTDKIIGVGAIGGGIGGLCLAIGLFKYPDIDIHVYEAAPSFGEIGAGVAFGPNAERALDLIRPAAREALRKRATPNLWPSHANIFQQYRVVSNLMEDLKVKSTDDSCSTRGPDRRKAPSSAPERIQVACKVYTELIFLTTL